jgi:transglutaminase-like putative cysteine protease
MYQARPAQVLASIPDGQDGIRETLKVMRDWAVAGSQTPAVRDQAVNIVFYIPKGAWVGKAKALWQWVKANIKYIPDPYGTEQLHWAATVLSQRYGDCDDQTILMAAMLLAVGIPTRIMAVALNQAGVFEHVFAQAYLGNDWVTMETTEDKPFGWSPPNIISRYISPVKG